MKKLVLDERGKELSNEEIREAMEGKTKGCETGLHDCTVYQHAIRVGDELMSEHGDIFSVGHVYTDYFDEKCWCQTICDKPQILSIDGSIPLTQSTIYRLGLKIYK